MKAEILAVGTELLMGEVINSNAAWISRELGVYGIDVYHHVTVGDNAERMTECFMQAAKRADCILITGGLGPTDDDITVATLAECFGGLPLVEDSAAVEAMKVIFARRGLVMPQSNLRQALRPESAVFLPNPVGTAPGFSWNVTVNGREVLILAFPGVPRELHALWLQAVALLRQKQADRGEVSEILVSRFLHFFGISESALAELLSDLMKHNEPSLAPYVGKQGIRMRIAAKAMTEEQALAIIEPVEAEIIRRTSDYYIGIAGKDESPLEAGLANLLFETGWTLGLAESCTGGLISSRLTDTPGSSGFTTLNYVTYSEISKQDVLSVSPKTLEAQGVVSAAAALEMAENLRTQGTYDITCAITGLAGPEGDDRGNPAGLAYIGLSFSPDVCRALKLQENVDHLPVNAHMRPDKSMTFYYEVRVNPSYTRKDIKFQFSQYALYYLWKNLQKKKADLK